MGYAFLEFADITLDTLLKVLEGIRTPSNIRAEAKISLEKGSTSIRIYGDHKSLPNLLMAFQTFASTDNVVFNLSLAAHSEQSRRLEELGIFQIPAPDIRDSEWAIMTMCEKRRLIMKWLLHCAGWKVGEFGTIMGISPSHASNIVRGARPLGVHLLRKLSDELPFSKMMGVMLDEVFEGKRGSKK